MKDSFSALVGTDVLAEGTETLKTRLEALTTNLATLKTAAGSQFSSQLDAVQSSVDQLKTVVDNADQAGAATTATQFAAGLGSLEDLPCKGCSRQWTKPASRGANGTAEA